MSAIGAASVGLLLSAFLGSSRQDLPSERVVWFPLVPLPVPMVLGTCNEELDWSESSHSHSYFCPSCGSICESLCPSVSQHWLFRCIFRFLQPFWSSRFGLSDLSCWTLFFRLLRSRELFAARFVRVFWCRFWLVCRIALAWCHLSRFFFLSWFFSRFFDSLGSGLFIWPPTSESIAGGGFIRRAKCISTKIMNNVHWFFWLQSNVHLFCAQQI